MPTWLLQLLDHFVPPARRENPVLVRQSRLLVSLLLLVIATVPWNCVVQASRGHWALLSVSSSTTLLYVFLLFAYPRKGMHRLTTHLLLTTGYLGILGAALMSGLLYSPVTPIFSALPLVALSLLGARGALHWTVASVLGILILFGLDVGGLISAESVMEHLKPVPVSLNLLLLVGYASGIGFFLDTINRLQRQEIERARAAADAANAAKSAFLANMSHELRTPMNGVLGLTELLIHDGRLDPDQLQHLHTIHRSGQTLVGLLNDILDLSKVESGGLELEDVPWRPERTLREVESLFAQSARRKGLNLSVQIASEVPPWVRGDPTRMRQVLLNLVGNAIKFTEQGGVELRLERNGQHLRFIVQDTGIGIPPEALSKIFEPFTQADSSTSRRHGGTGLGLTISLRLTEKMDGNLSVASEIGHGSRFTVDLPLRIAEPPEEASQPIPPIGAPELDAVATAPPRPLRLLQVHTPESDSPTSKTTPEPAQEKPEQKVDCEPEMVPQTQEAAPQGPPRCLLVEDMPINQIVARMMMERLGFEVEIVADGPEALSRILAGGDWQVILMDWQLPGMDGVEITERARAAGVRTRIVGVTANVRPEDRAAGLASGMDAFVGKPFTLAELQAALDPT
jgi:signal transduction histidine kinase/CheY-like chemotaxis protein